MDSGLATEAMPDEYISSLRISQFLLVNANQPVFTQRRFLLVLGLPS